MDSAKQVHSEADFAGRHNWAQPRRPSCPGYQEIRQVREMGPAFLLPQESEAMSAYVLIADIRLGLIAATANDPKRTSGYEYGEKDRTSIVERRGYECLKSVLPR